MCVCICSGTQLCLTLCDPMNYSPPVSSVHGVFQARILEWVTISSSKGSSRSRDQTSVSCVSCIAGRSLTIEPSGKPYVTIRSDQIRSVAQSCPTLCDPMNRSTPASLSIGEEIPFVQDKEQWLRFAGPAVKRYPTPRVRETQERW